MIDSSNLSNKSKNELYYDYAVASASILEWMRHILRGVQTQKTKEMIMKDLSESKAMVIGDWMMKIIPLKYWEKMEEWFGKKGISGHVNCFFLRNSEEKLVTATYFTFIDKCNQDMAASSCVLKNDLEQFHTDFPDIEFIHCRNDNAGCYSGASAILAKKEICDQVGKKLQSIDFNEAQKGKDQCDHDGAVAKRNIRTYVNEGHDVTDAVSVKEGIDASPGILKNSKSCVIELDYNNLELGKAKTKDISRYHYFEFEENGIRAWEFQGIGNGKLLQQQDVNFISCSKVVKPFAETFDKRSRQQVNNNRNSKMKVWCSDSDCSAVYKSEEALSDHILKGSHIYLEKHGEGTKLSSTDRVKIVFADKLLFGNKTKVSSQLPGLLSSTATEVSNKEGPSLNVSAGWALKARRKVVKFSTKQKRYLVSLFEQGEKTNRKEDPKNVADMMRKARAPSGAKMFEPSEYLRKEQIASFFSRLSAQRSKGKPLQIEDELEDQEPADDYQKEFELQRSLFQMIDAISKIDSSTFAKQPSSSNVPMDEAEVTQPIEEKEDTPTLPLNVKKIYGDGRCLFRSVVVACDNALLSCERNEGSWPKDVGLASHETKKADELRTRTIKMWKANKLVYQSHA